MHTIKKCYKKHFLVSCAKCGAMFHVPMSGLRFKKVKENGSKLWRSKKLIECPGCNSQQQGAASKWYWFPSLEPLPTHSVYERAIVCDFGRITHMQIYSPSKNYLFFSASPTGQVRGTFLSEDSHFKVALSTQCHKHDDFYVLRPFTITISSNNLIVTKLSYVAVTEPHPFVLIKEEDDYALLSRSCEFTAQVAYHDPIVALRWK